MDEQLTFVSTFAGIEGIGEGLRRAGWKCVAQVEIDKFCRRVLERRSPDVAKFGDIREFGAASLRDALRTQRPRSSVADQPAAESAERSDGEGRQRTDGDDDTHVELDRLLDVGVGDGARRGGIRDEGREASRRPAIDLLCGGFPCQDVSVAGRRAGLAGARSGLFFEFVRVARELRPRWLLVENVPGLLSSNEGRDFAVVLAELGAAGYFLEWRVLDSRWFGVPQRRRRVFLVGHLGGPPARSVLFEREGGDGDPAAISAPGEDIARPLTSGTNSVGGSRRPGTAPDDADNLIAHSLRGRPNASHREDSDTYIPEVSFALTKRDHKGVSVRESATTLMVTHSLTKEGADASEDGTGRGVPLVVAETLTSGSHPNSSAPSRHREDDVNLVLALRDERGRHNEGGVLNDEAHTLHAMKGPSESQVIYRKSKRAATDQDDETWVPDDYANTLNGFDSGDQRATELVAFSARAVRNSDSAHEVGIKDGQTHDTLQSDGPMSIGQADGAGAVRRLTPTECERLQGFPDGWTCLCGCEPYSTAACRCPDGPRYAAVGNAVTVNVAEWVGRRILAASS